MSLRKSLPLRHRIALALRETGDDTNTLAIALECDPRTVRNYRNQEYTMCGEHLERFFECYPWAREQVFPPSENKGSNVIRVVEFGKKRKVR